MKRALIVDDDPSVSRLLACFLRTLGWDGRCVGDHETAFRKFLAYEPNLLICDVHLKGWHGVELAQQCLKFNRSLRVIMISGFTEGLVFARESGLQCFKKPFDLVALKSVIEELNPVEQARRKETDFVSAVRY